MKRNRTLRLAVGCVAAIALFTLVIWAMVAPEGQPPALQTAVNTTAQPTGEAFGVNFPRPVSSCELEVRSMTNYTGTYVEDGSDSQVTGVAMAHITNIGSRPVEYAQIQVAWDEEILQFRVSLLLPGESVLVQEAQKKAMPDGVVTQCSAQVAMLSETDWQKQLSVTDNADGSLTVANLTDRDFAQVRLFYKYYSQEQQLYVGGIAFTAKITELKAGTQVTVRPSHYAKDASRVVTAAIYDTAQ